MMYRRLSSLRQSRPIQGSKTTGTLAGGSGYFPIVEWRKPPADWTVYGTLFPASSLSCDSTWQGLKYMPAAAHAAINSSKPHRARQAFGQQQRIVLERRFRLRVVCGPETLPLVDGFNGALTRRRALQTSIAGVGDWRLDWVAPGKR